MDSSPLATAGRMLAEGIAGLRAACDTSADGDTRIAALVWCESLTRQLEHLSISLIAELDESGEFAQRGYTRPGYAVADLLGMDTGHAARRVKLADQVIERRTLDGQSCPPRLPATATVFAAGEVSLRHVEVITDALATPAAQRLTPQGWAGVEEQLAEHARMYRPREVAVLAHDLIELLDHDGAEPDYPDLQVNELHLTRTAGGAGGGRIKGQLDAPTFDALATALAPLTRPSTDDDRSLGERQADALTEICRQALDSGELGEVGGQRPHLTVTIGLADLETRARGAALDFGGPLTPAALRMLACDAAVIPIVLGGSGQPLDIGRATRTIPVALRRAVRARDHGCAFPGCGRPPARCDVHHIIPWEHGGTTDINNCVMLCRFHHRLLHHPGWIVRIHNGQPEFIPPKWIDTQQIPRRRPPPNEFRDIPEPHTADSQQLVGGG